MRSIELLRSTLNDWSLIYGRKMVDSEVDVWMRIFKKQTNIAILTEALEKVTEQSQRMPTPGMLTKAIAEVTEAKNFGTKAHSNLTYREGFDEKGVPCVFWSDEPNVPAYKATNCPEGRAFLATLARVAGIDPERAAKLMEKWSSGA